jgi:hypothetical protein
LEQLDKERDAALVDDGLTLSGSASRHVGQSPSGLELQLRVLTLLHEFDHLWDQTCVDDFLDGRVLLHRQNFPNADHTLVLLDNILIVEKRDKLREEVYGVVAGEEAA